MIKSLLLVFTLSAVGLCYGGEGDIVQVDQEAPTFTGTSTDGTAVELASLTGKVVLLDFFATWCGPCMQEMPRIELEVWRQFRGDGLVVLGVGREHSVAELKKFKDLKGFTFSILADPKREIYSKYAGSFIPRCYLIGRDGKVKYAVSGYTPSEFDGLKSAVAAELKK